MLVGLRRGHSPELALSTLTIESHDDRDVVDGGDESDMTTIGRNRNVADLRQSSEVFDRLRCCLDDSAARAQYGGADRDTGGCGH